MKNVMTILAVLVGFQAAQATSMHPCSPVIPLSPTYLSCSKNNVSFGITVQTSMSDPRRCPEKNRVEFKMAHIEVVSQGRTVKKFSLYGNNFTYKLGIGNGSFQSQKAGLNLTNCTSPQHGAFSVGN